MKRFIRDILIFGFMVVAALIFAEVYVRSLPNAARDKHQWMLQHADEVETLILGSSHTFYGINPDRLGDNAYSLALVSQTYRYDCWLLQNYPFRHLKNVILPFSYFSLYEDGESGVGEDIAARYCIYMDYPQKKFLSKYNFEFMDMQRFKEKLKSIYQPQQMSWNEKGWGSNYTYERRDEVWDNGESRALKNTYADTSAVTLNLCFLKEMAAWARKHQVHLFLVSTPVSETFREYQDRGQTARNKQVLATFLVENPEVSYLDFEADERFVNEDFYDSDHLSDKGARKLTEILRQVL